MNKFNTDNSSLGSSFKVDSLSVQVERNRVKFRHVKFNYLT